MSPRRPDTSPHQDKNNPGPGQYSSMMKAVIKENKGYTFGSEKQRPLAGRKGHFPSPDRYFPKDVSSKKEASKMVTFGHSKRKGPIDNDNIKANPGPGSYDPFSRLPKKTGFYIG
jgi:hypothetical protein